MIKHWKSTLALLLFACSQLVAQPVKLDWVHSFGSTVNESGLAICLDKQGNTIVAGLYGALIDFDPGTGVLVLPDSGAANISIQKFNQGGQLVWAKSFWGHSSIGVSDITIDALGNLVLVGSFKDSADFDPGPGVFKLQAMSQYDAFVLKLDSIGNFIWAKSYGSYLNESAVAVKVDSNSNVYTIGSFRQTVDFDPGPLVSNLTSTQRNVRYIQKLDPNGDFVWVKPLGGVPFWFTDFNLEIDHLNFLYVAGGFSGQSVDFDPGAGTSYLSTTGNHSDSYIQKLDTNGYLVWVKQFSGNFEVGGSALDIDNNGNIYTSGYFNHLVDFDPSQGQHILDGNNGDFYIVKLSPSGQLNWVRQIGGTSYKRSISTKVNSDGLIYSAGFFQGDINFNMTADSFIVASEFNSYDLFAFSLDTNGNFVWGDRFGDSQSDYLSDMEIDQFGNAYLIGEYRRTIDFDPRPSVHALTSAGDGDMFIQKLSPCPQSFDTLTLNVCQYYLSPSGKTWDSTGTYKDTIANSISCDSILLYHINKVEIDSSIQLIGDTLYANELNATYQWLDCDSNLKVISGANSNSFKPLRSGNFALETSKNSCKDTSSCFNYTSVGYSSIKQNKTWSVYPNPSSGIFQVNLPNGSRNSALEVYDLSGKLIIENEPIDGNTIIFKLLAPQGVYFLKLKSESGYYSVKRLIKY